MNNFQLYSTNILLGGQVCWDLSINKIGNSAYINDFQILPINENIPYAFKIKSDLLEQPHINNLLNFYQKIKDNFYNGYINESLKSKFPIILNQEEYNYKQNNELYNNVYNMGCIRSKHYKFNKDFEFFCPIWLEQLNSSILNFELIAKNINNHEIIGKINIPFKITNKYEYHDRFINYFYKYINKIELDKGNDNLININLFDNTFKLYGISMESGQVYTINNNYIIQDLLKREKSLMENDNIIISSFKQNKFIIPQLFNFRFHFNLNDIINEPLLSLLNWNNIEISMNVNFKDEENNIIQLPKKDFYTNYEYINRLWCTFKYNDANIDPQYKSLNVLDYLKDNKSINLMDKNKIYHPICHWSLNDNNDYIFNLYDGFSGFSINEDNNIINHKRLYGNSADIYQSEYFENLNNIAWCNCYPINMDDGMDKKIQTRIKIHKLNYITINEICDNNTSEIIKDNLTTQINKQLWMNNYKYNIDSIVNKNNQLRILTGYFQDGKNGNIEQIEQEFEIKLNNSNYKYLIANPYQINKDKIYFLYKEDEKNQSDGGEWNIFYIFSNNKNYLTYKGIRHLINSDWFKKICKEKNANIIFDKSKILYKFLKSLIKPRIIRFNKSIKYKSCKGPSPYITEIYYIKDNNIPNKYILRYDGKIKPTFLSKEESEEKNLFYYKKYFILQSFQSQQIQLPIKQNKQLQIVEKTNLNKSSYFIHNNKINNFENLLKTNYEPLYKSIDFFATESIKLNYIEPNILLNHQDFEYKWFNNNKILYIPNNIILNFEINEDEIKNNNSGTFNDLFKEKLYNSLNIDNDIRKYIQQYLNYIILDDSIELNQSNNEKKLKYKYKVKLTLK